MSWSNEQIINHQKASELLYWIMQDSFGYIKNNENITEFKLQRFILEEFRKNNLKMDRNHPWPIVAFDENSAFPHYFPKEKSKKIKPNTFILIDIWARLEKKKAPFSDITWLAYHGKKAPEEISEIFEKTIQARNTAINFIRSSLRKKIIPTGQEIDAATSHFISKAVSDEVILHRTGHSIGTLSPHGIFGHLNLKNKKPLEKNLGYTIEPGIYLKNKFGMRSEINFFIDGDLKMNITTKMQKEIVLIK